MQSSIYRVWYEHFVGHQFVSFPKFVGLATQITIDWAIQEVGNFRQ